MLENGLALILADVTFVGPVADLRQGRPDHGQGEHGQQNGHAQIRHVDLVREIVEQGLAGDRVSGGRDPV